MGLYAATELPLLKPRANAQPRTVRFKGVYWHKGIQRYTTRTATRKTYKTAHAAAQAIGVVKKGLKPSTILSSFRAKAQRRQGATEASGTE